MRVGQLDSRGIVAIHSEFQIPQVVESGPFLDVDFPHSRNLVWIVTINCTM